MSCKINNLDVGRIKYGSQEITKVIFNGHILWQRVVDMDVSVSYTQGNSYFDLVFSKPDATQCTILYRNKQDEEWKAYTGTVSATGCRFSATTTTTTKFYIAISHPKYNTCYINYVLTYTPSSTSDSFVGYAKTNAEAANYRNYGYITVWTGYEELWKVYKRTTTPASWSGGPSILS